MLLQLNVTRQHLELGGLAICRVLQIIAVRNVFGGVCDDSELELRTRT